MNICTVYVTFNPDIEYLKNSITAIRTQVRYVIIVDNSDNKNFQKEVKLLAEGNVIVLTQNRNIGIAAALNVGCNKAIELGAQWALTLDQDSMPPVNMVLLYKDFIRINEKVKVGAIGSRFTFSEEDKLVPSNIVEKVNTLITSGCFMNLEAYSQIGGFREELFIDAVDTEYSWKLRKNGYELYRLNNIILEHHIGSGSFHIKLFGKRFMTITNHNYIRCYYMARNSQQISEDYKNIFPEEAKFYRKKAWKKIVMVIFFEKDKLRKIQYIRKGICDYKKGNLGAYDEQ